MLNVPGFVLIGKIRKSVAQQASVISSCDASFAKEESPAADIIHPTTLEADICESYWRELDRKEAEIQRLNRQLESSCKLVKFYKRKSERQSMVEQKENDDREHEPKQRTLLKEAIQDAIIDLIKADRSYSRTKSDHIGQAIAQAVFA